MFFSLVKLAVRYWESQWTPFVTVSDAKRERNLSTEKIPGFEPKTFWILVRSLTRLSSNTESTMDAKDSSRLHAHNHISNLNNNCFVAKWFAWMRTILENGIANKAIVLQWPVRTASWDLKVVKKRWASTLLSVKCCCFVQKPSWKSYQLLICPSKEEKEETFKKNILAFWWLSSSVFLWCFFMTVGVLFIM